MKRWPGWMSAPHAYLTDRLYSTGGKIDPASIAFPLGPHGEMRSSFSDWPVTRAHICEAPEYRLPGRDIVVDADGAVHG